MTSFSMHRARDAYLSALMVSSALPLDGDMLTNINVFAVPPKLSCMSIVSLWFRYGTTFNPDVIPCITSPSAVSDLLISIASFLISPTELLFEMRSLPARSTIVIFPCLVRPVSGSAIRSLIMNKRCDLDESAFIVVEATFLCLKPLSTACLSSAELTTSTSVQSNLATSLPSSFLPFLMSIFGGTLWHESKSQTLLLYSSTIEALTVK